MTVDQIFSETKAIFEYKTDQEQFQKQEHWMTAEEIQSQINKTGKITGDCDDFATAIVVRLRKQGFRARFVLAKTEFGFHLVAEHDGLIFDNLQNQVIPFFRLPYKWISISGFQPNQVWREIK